jgi:SpoVK/Ycf46/Vps4 family AAA+-type ATPase
LYS